MFPFDTDDGVSVTTDLVTRFAQRFAGHPGYFARGYLRDAERDKYGYAKHEAPLDRSVYKRHLQGDEVVGVYPITDLSQVKWFAVDFDAPKGFAGTKDESFVLVVGDALAQVAAFEQAGLFTYLERSRSGAGVHVWGFLDAWADAAMVRRAVFGLLLDSPYLDRGKVYPSDPEKSDHGVLIGLPYQPQAVAKGYSMFVRHGTFAPIPLAEFLDLAVDNYTGIIERLAATAKVVERGSYTPRDGAPANGGRPEPLLPTGVLKLVSAHGCTFMRHALMDQEQLTEPEWYAALGQLTAFEHGRDAAHALWRDYPWYDAPGMDAKFDQAAANPPVGCAFIHERFPQHACTGCPMKAPYYRAQEPLDALVQDALGDMEQGGFDADLERIARFDRGEEESGLVMGRPGIDEYVRFRPSETTVIAAQPSMGKTALAIDIAVSIARQGTEVHFFSAESGRRAIHDRVLAHIAEVDSLALRGERTWGPNGGRLTHEEWTRLRAAVEELKALPLFLNYSASSPEQVVALVERSRVKRRVALRSPFLVIFDFLQLVGEYTQSVSREEKTNERIARYMRGFKNAQKVLGAPFVLLSQTTRDAADDDKPGMTVGAGTRAIEQLSDQLLVLTGEYRDGPEAPRQLHQVKNKEGRVGRVIDLLLQQAICRFDAKPRFVPPEPPVLADGEDAFGQWGLGSDARD